MLVLKIKQIFRIESLISKRTLGLTVERKIDKAKKRRLGVAQLVEACNYGPTSFSAEFGNSQRFMGPLRLSAPISIFTIIFFRRKEKRSFL